MNWSTTTPATAGLYLFIGHVRAGKYAMSWLRLEPRIIRVRADSQGKLLFMGAEFYDPGLLQGAWASLTEEVAAGLAVAEEPILAVGARGVGAALAEVSWGYTDEEELRKLLGESKDEFGDPKRDVLIQKVLDRAVTEGLAERVDHGVWKRLKVPGGKNE